MNRSVNAATASVNDALLRHLREQYDGVCGSALLPRRAATAYLRWRRRNPQFFERHVFYTTNARLTRFLRRRGRRLFHLRVDRFDTLDMNNNARRIFLLLQRTGVLPPAKTLFQASLLKRSFALDARKPGNGR